MRDTSASYSRGCLALIMSALEHLRTEDFQTQVIQAITALPRYVFHSADRTSSHPTISPAYAKDRDCTARNIAYEFSAYKEHTRYHPRVGSALLPSMTKVSSGASQHTAGFPPTPISPGKQTIVGDDRRPASLAFGRNQNVRYPQIRSQQLLR